MNTQAIIYFEDNLIIISVARFALSCPKHHFFVEQFVLLQKFRVGLFFLNFHFMNDHLEMP
ncbi:hypothetical protein T02_15749 [Trichinella nativa]|uniref:Uncharacterized protein n=1 Tax=Trichinella nativa TaxID=6335 RepID=A0A0V1L8S3_9BILA|nr:hypothetical protein T02_15749 [Trichinella nativa]